MKRGKKHAKYYSKKRIFCDYCNNICKFSAKKRSYMAFPHTNIEQKPSTHYFCSIEHLELWCFKIQRISNLEVNEFDFKQMRIRSRRMRIFSK